MDTSAHYMSEASYKTSSILKDMEKVFKQLIDYYSKFEQNMKKNNLDPNNPSDVYNYYYSYQPEKDKFRYTQFNEYLKTIEDLVKKMFRFRSVNIEFQIICIYGPHTYVGNKTIMTIPVVFRDGTKRIINTRDVGIRDKDGVKYRVGYPTTLKASAAGIVDENNSINIDIKLDMHEKFQPKHYVAILLHEIGHNIDIDVINADVKNDGKMINVISTALNDNKMKVPGKISVFAKLLKERMINHHKYSKIAGDILEKVGGNISTGGDDKHSELFADALPTSFGYGPALAEALNIFSNDIGNVNFSNKDNIISIYMNYLKALNMASRIQKREIDVHGSHIYRIKKMIESLESDLKKTKDTTLKRRILSNIRDLNKMIDSIIHNDNIPDEVYQMLNAWVNSIR